MGRNVGAKPRTSSAAQQLLDRAEKFRNDAAAWSRRMTLLSFSFQICGEGIHPDEITRYAGTFEAFVLEGTVPPEPREVVTLQVAPKQPKQPNPPDQPA
jgi:hypothetical protein